MAPARLGPPPGARIAVVGGAGGIGRAVVAMLASEDARLAVLDLPATLARHPPLPGVHAIPFDATDDASVAAGFEALAATVDALDGLVLLAGFASAPTPVADTATETWRAVIDGNLTAAFSCARAALPLLRAGRNPAAVIASSGLALKPTPGYGPYAAAKAGLLALTRILASETAPWLRVNAVAPGAVDTAFLRGGTGRGGDDTAPERFDRAAYLRTVPLGRIAVPDDVAGPMLFLLGPASAYITGQTLHVNGGALMP